MKYTHLIFDLDGTLTDSGLGILRSARYALEHFGIHVEDLQELRPFVGPPLEQSFQRFYGLNEEEALEACRVYRVRYRQTGVYENEVYPGIPEALQQLQEAGYQLMIGSSKPIDMVDIVLDHFHLRRFFNYIGARDMEGRLYSKSDVLRDLLCRATAAGEQQRILMIGDRKFDVEGAHELGLPCVGVLWGYGDRAEMEACGADYIAERVGDLRDLLI